MDGVLGKSFTSVAASHDTDAEPGEQLEQVVGTGDEGETITEGNSTSARS
jgi:hypothetical protein